MTQARAYRGIRLQRPTLQRLMTAANLELIRTGVNRSAAVKRPTDATTWHAVRHKGVSRNGSDFLWKAIPNAPRVGNYWTHIPGYEERAACLLCDDHPIETLEHILLKCCAPERRIVWQLCERLWRKRETTWPALSYGLILGRPLADVRAEGGPARLGASRLFRIMIPDSVFLIWKLRSERPLKTGMESPQHPPRRYTDDG